MIAALVNFHQTAGNAKVSLCNFAKPTEAKRNRLAAIFFPVGCGFLVHDTDGIDSVSPGFQNVRKEGLPPVALSRGEKRGLGGPSTGVIFCTRVPVGL